MPRRPQLTLSRLPVITAIILFTGLGAVSFGHRHDPVPRDLAASKIGTPQANPMPKGPQLSPPESGIIPDATVQRDKATGRIIRIRGRIQSPGAQSAAAAAERFLKTYAEKLSIADFVPNLRLTREVSSLAGFHVTYGQTYSGLPILGGQISVHTDKRFSIQLVNISILPLTIDRPIQQKIASQAAANAALAAVNSQVPVVKGPAVSAAVLIQDGAPIAVWKVNFRTSRASWEVLVDAASGAVLSRRNIAQYVDGAGKVFEPNPVQSTGIADLLDNANADSPVLTAARVVKPILGLDGTGKLTGAYCSTGITTRPPFASEPSFTYNYLRSDSRFEQTMVYYNVDTIERYIQGLGFGNIENRQVECDANNDDDSFDNSYYDPFFKQIVFGAGGVDDAEDADVIWHENGHAIQDDQVPGWGATEEGGAMGEGFGDYWAASNETAIGGPQSPGWDVYLAKWDAVSYNPGNPAYLRRLDSTKHYPEDLDGEVHDDGEIWSACLYQIRGIVGRTRADTMFLEAHFSLDPFAQMADGANAILLANDNLYAGANGRAILQVFVDRGILTLPPPITLVLNPNPADSGTTVTGIVKLLDAAPPGGETINLSSDNTGVATVDQDSFVIPEGEFIGTFTITTSDSISGIQSANITAILARTGDSDTKELTVIAFLDSILFYGLYPSYDLITAGDIVPTTINLTQPAPEGGAVVTLGSTDPSVAYTTPSVTVQAGRTSAYFWVFTRPVAETTTAFIFGQARGSLAIGALTVHAPRPVGLQLSPQTVVGGNLATGTVQLNYPAPPGGMPISLSSSNSNVASVPASVVIQQGSMTGSFPITTYPVTSNKTVTITASDAEGSVAAKLTVTPATGLISSLVFNPSTVNGGSQARGVVILTRPAPSGGLVVTLTKGPDPQGAIGTLPTVTVPPGYSSATFYVPTNWVPVDSTVTITATSGSSSKSANLTVRAPHVTSVTAIPVVIHSGTQTTVRVFMSGPSPTAITVPITYTGPATGPSSITVPVGKTAVAFLVTGTPVTASTTAKITATYPVATSKSATITVTP